MTKFEDLHSHLIHEILEYLAESGHELFLFSHINHEWREVIMTSSILWSPNQRFINLPTIFQTARNYANYRQFCISKEITLSLQNIMSNRYFISQDVLYKYKKKYRTTTDNENTLSENRVIPHIYRDCFALIWLKTKRHAKWIHKMKKHDDDLVRLFNSTLMINLCNFLPCFLFIFCLLGAEICQWPFLYLVCYLLIDWILVTILIHVILYCWREILYMIIHDQEHWKIRAKLLFFVSISIFIIVLLSISIALQMRHFKLFSFFSIIQSTVDTQTNNSYSFSSAWVFPLIPAIIWSLVGMFITLICFTKKLSESSTGFSEVSSFSWRFWFPLSMSLLYGFVCCFPALFMSGVAFYYWNEPFPTPCPWSYLLIPWVLHIIPIGLFILSRLLPSSATELHRRTSFLTTDSHHHHHFNHRSGLIFLIVSLISYACLHTLTDLYFSQPLKLVTTVPLGIMVMNLGIVLFSLFTESVWIGDHLHFRPH
jgi:hypothetical protein